MTNTRLTCPALLCALVVVSVATCGCASIRGTTDRWATAWRKSTEPKPVDPNREEIVTYWGQKKKEPKLTEMPPELKERLAKKSDDSQRSRDYADNFKAGNQHLKEGRLDEARRAYELALAVRPDDPDIHHRLAVVADKQKLFGVADDHYEAALLKRPRDPNLLSDIGYSHVLRSDDRGAEKALREALAIDPSHKGAMLNLGTLYSKQRRYDDALALLRLGTTEAETQQYMTQLFPQGRPSNVALASNQADAESRTVRTIPNDDRTDVRTMTSEQLKAEWERRQLEENQNRQAQFAQGALQRDWMGGPLVQDAMQDPRAMQDQRSAPAPNNQPWSAGQPLIDQFGNPVPSNNPGIGQSPSYPGQTQGSNSMQPGAAMVPLPNDLQPGSTMLPYPGPASNGAVQRPGFAPNSGRGSLVAPPGTKPNIDFWQGVPAQPNAGAFNPNPASPQSTIEQMGHSQGGADSNASQAAAQLGMNAGPGSLFPIVSGDSASAGGMSESPSVAPARDQRFGNEFSQPPRSQNSNGQSAPSNVPNQGRAWSQGNDGATSGQFLPNWQGAAPVRPSGEALPNFAGNNTSVAPPSSAGNLSRPWDAPSNSQPPNSNTGSNVIQAGGFPNWGESASRINDSLDAYQSNTSVPPRSSRYAKAPWDEPASSPSGSRPYSGAWPSSNDQPNASSSGSGGSSNSLPMWNGGSGAGASTSSGVGSATGSSSNNSLPQWPYSSPR